MKKTFAKQRVHQGGVTLVELMVSLAIGMVISLAATIAYMAVRGTSLASGATSRINEDGKLALDMLSREIQMAGFYPAAITDTATPNVRGGYVNIKGATKPAYDQGLFGCSAAKFSPVTATCGTAATTLPDSARDSIVVNYFSSNSKQDVGTGNVSVSRDCINGRLGEYDAVTNKYKGDPVNKARVDATPRQPLFVSNRFAINTTSYSQASSGSGGNDAAKTITTGSLACNGNGASSESTTFQPIFEGVDQLVLRYAVYDGTQVETPSRFYTATEVSALPIVDDKSGWRRVSAVRICLLMRSLTGGRNDAGSSAPASTYTDCLGNSVTQAATDRNIFKTMTRVVAVRNHLTGIQ